MLARIMWRSFWEQWSCRLESQVVVLPSSQGGILVADDLTIVVWSREECVRFGVN
jgi:hypothetical protein